MFPVRAALAAVMCLASWPVLSATNYIVSTSGKDLNAGTALAPLASLQRAVMLAQPGDTITVRAGVYPISQPVTISGKVGTEALPIKIVGERGAMGGERCS